MADKTSDRPNRVAAAASRLRLLQVDLADKSPEARMHYLAEEIQRALAHVVPQERKQFLQELMSEFPTWDKTLDVIPLEEQVAAWSRTDQRELADPSFLVSRLAELLPTLSDAQKQALVAHLRDAGLAPQLEGDRPEEALSRVREALKLDSKAALSQERLTELVAPLIRFALGLEPVVRQTWSLLAPKSTMLGSSSLQQSLNSFVAGDKELPGSPVERDIEKLRGLVGSMAYALGRVVDFATGHLTRFSPGKIEDIVRLEPRGVGSLLVAKEVRFWRKYAELAERFLTEAAVETEFKDRIRSFIEETVRRRAAPKRGAPKPGRE